MIFSNQYEETVDLLFRWYLPGDDKAILECLMEEYGETYDNPNYYVPNYFEKQVTGGIFEILEVFHQKRLIGFLVVKTSEYFPGQYEMATMVIAKEYREFGVSGELIQRCVEHLDGKPITASYGHAQVFHTRSVGRLCQSGMVPTGYLFSTFFSEKLKHSFGESKSLKLPWAIAVKPVSKWDAGTLYAPKCHQNITQQVYDSLGVAYEIGTPEGSAPQGKTNMAVHPYYSQESLVLVVDEIGTDLIRVVDQVLETYDSPALTVNLCLNLLDCHAPWGYAQLAKHHFFFAGFQPLAEDAEYMILHNPKGVAIDFQDLKPFAPIAFLKTYIQQAYERMKHG